MAEAYALLSAVEVFLTMYVSNYYAFYLGSLSMYKYGIRTWHLLNLESHILPKNTPPTLL